MIDSDIDNNNEELIVKLSGINWFRMKVVLQDDNIKIEYYKADTSEPTLEPPLKLSNTTILAFEDISEEKIGDEFFEAFQPIIKLYNTGKE